MQETFESKIENGPEKPATDIHLEQLNPQLWKELSGLSSEQQDERWFSLTQKHLKDYKEGKSTEEGFKSEELEFIFLNSLGAKNNPLLSPETPQRGFYFDPEKQPKQRMEKFGNFGNFIMTDQNKAEQHIKETQKPFHVLVGGIGISGKATLRNVLSRQLREKLSERKVISWDRDYQKIFPIPSEWQGDINVIEDVHGLDEERDENGKLKRFDGIEGLHEGYNMVVYVLPTASTFRQNLIRRGMGWLKIGKLDLTAPEKQYPEEQKERIIAAENQFARLVGEIERQRQDHIAKPLEQTVQLG